MSADNANTSDYKPLAPTAGRGGPKPPAPASLKAPRSAEESRPAERFGGAPPATGRGDVPHARSLINPHSRQTEKTPSAASPEALETKTGARADAFVSAPAEAFAAPAAPAAETSYAEAQRARRREKKRAADRALLGGEKWLVRNGHTLSYAGLYLFSVLVLFRPYELVPGLSFLAATAFYFALATLAVYVPTQIATEGNLTTLSTEVKAILALTALSVLTMPIAKSPPLAWETFNDTFVKAVLMFIVMVNVLRTRRRLMGLVWLSLSVAFVLSWQALDLFMKGELKAEGYRVDVEIGGMFGNPNDLSLHLVTMIPLAVALGIAARSKLLRLVYWTMAALFVSANFVTYSRGGFLGLVAASAVLVWKLGRRSRLNVSVVSLTVGLVVTLLAPGNYGMRILSIFGLAPDEVGSRDQRRELLERSILVTLRNPWGIGIGNFPIVGVHNLVTHNAFTQVSSEIGLLGLAAYLVFMISPFRKLGAIERTLFERDETDWYYYLAIGLQASIVAYLVSSFFVAVAYNWFIYYLIAYAVAFRRVYRIERKMPGETEAARA